jgi:hypothetical protein
LNRWGGEKRSEQGRADTGVLAADGGEEGVEVSVRGGERSPMAVAPPQTMAAAAPPHTSPPQACAAWRSGGEGEGGGAEASAAERRRGQWSGGERGGSERRRARRLGFGQVWERRQGPGRTVLPR